MYKGLRIGLALGGGGARGFAHLGILRVFKKAGIDIDVYAGTSMGAIIMVAHMQNRNFKRSDVSLKNFVLRFANEFKGMNYAESKTSAKTPFSTKLYNNFKRGSQFLNLISRKSVEDDHLLDEITESFIYPCNLEDLPHKVYVSTLDVVTGQQVLLYRGNARRAIKASMSIAGYFPGVAQNDRLLIDSQAVFPVPIQAFLKDEVDVIIAANVSTYHKQDFQPNNGIDMLFRQNDLTFPHILSEIQHCSDILIEPDLHDDIHWTDFQKMDHIIRQGVLAANDALVQLDAVCEKKSRIKKIQDRPWHLSGYRDTPRTVLETCDPNLMNGDNLHGKL